MAINELFQNANNIAELLSTTEFSQEKIEKYYNSLIFFNSIEYNSIQCPHFKDQSALLLYAFNYNLTNLIANTVLYIHYDNVSNLTREDITNYIGEVLKTETPLQVVLRIAIKDNILANNVIKKGELISIIIGNANQDMPSSASILSFGHGIHKCIGEKISMLITKKIIELLFIKYKLKVEVKDFNWENIYGFRSLKDFKVKLCKMN